MLAFDAIGMDAVGVNGATVNSAPSSPPSGPGTDVTMDANLVPRHRWVIFEGTSRVLTFEGTKRTVVFEGTNRTVRYLA